MISCSKLARARWVGAIVAVFAAIGLGGATAESASAAKAVVNITHEFGLLAETGEPVAMFPNISFTGAGECGAGESGRIAVNHAAVAIVDGLGKNEGTYCSNEHGETEGEILLTAIKIAKNGKVAVEIHAAIKAANGCKYEIKKLKGTQDMQTTFQVPLGPEGTGTAKLHKEAGGPAGCAKTVPVAWFYPIEDLSGNYYEVGLALA